MFEETIKRYNGKVLEDDVYYNSKMFLDLAKRIKREVIRFKTHTSLIGYRVGHYEVSGYLNRGDKYIYFSYSAPQGEFEPINMRDDSVFNGILYRKVKDPRDSRGGINHFTNFFNFEEDINSLFEEDF